MNTKVHNEVYTVYYNEGKGWTYDKDYPSYIEAYYRCIDLRWEGKQADIASPNDLIVLDPD